VKIYKGMPIGQLIYFCVEGAVIHSYKNKLNAKYTATSHLPVGSQMWRNLF
jgi:dCTP deaminase